MVDQKFKICAFNHHSKIHDTSNNQKRQFNRKQHLFWKFKFSCSNSSFVSQARIVAFSSFSLWDSLLSDLPAHAPTGGNQYVGISRLSSLHVTHVLVWIGISGSGMSEVRRRWCLGWPLSRMVLVLVLLCCRFRIRKKISASGLFAGLR